jgi:hypothetical protein
MKMKRIPGVALGTALFVVALALPRVGSCSSAVVFNAKSKEGEVWVSVDLTRQRLTEDYIPLLTVVRNTSGQSVTLDRGSFRLIGADHRSVQLADFNEWRKDYHKANFDLTIMRFFGLPLGTLLDFSRLEPSNFFPVVGENGIRLDNVTLPNFYWTGDMLYFKRPAGLSEGRKVVLEIHPKGWETPIRVDIQL